MKEEFDFSGRKVMFAIPSYEARVSFQWMSAFRNIENALFQHGIEYKTEVLLNSALIANARAELAQRFLDSDCDTLIFIDDDVICDATAMLRLIAWTEMFEIVGGVYCARQDPPKFHAKFHGSKQNETYSANDYGLILAEYIPGGFIAIQRKVLEDAVKHYAKDLTFVLHNEDPTSGKAVHLWLQFIDPQTQICYGEDTAFCARMTAIGKKIWIDPELNLKHEGQKSYDYQFHNYIYKVKPDGSRC